MEILAKKMSNKRERETERQRKEKTPPSNLTWKNV